MENDPQRPSVVQPERVGLRSRLVAAVTGIGVAIAFIIDPLIALLPIWKGDQERDTSWRWMVGIAVGVGLLAWFTR